MAEGDEGALLGPGASAAGGPAADAGEVSVVAGSATGASGAHPARDPDATHRLAAESAARVGAAGPEAEELWELAGEVPREPAAGFCLALGVIVGALLLVLWLTGIPPEAPERALTPRFPPAAALPPGTRRSPPRLLPFRAPASPLFQGETAPGQPTLPGRASGRGTAAAVAPALGEPAETASPGPLGQEPGPTAPVSGGMPGNEPPLPPGATAPPLAPGRGQVAAPGLGAPELARPGAGALPEAGSAGKAGGGRLLYPPAFPPSAPALPGR